MEYSAREVSPPQLLLAHLQQAHSIFLLHHAISLNELLQRLGRELFADILERFWNRFSWDWDVLLHGNPTIDIYNSVKLAGGGEIGMGVGEEEWGSGEREVLEDFVHRTEGLVDILVGRYGDAPQEASASKEAGKLSTATPWLGLGDDSRASDGILFSGVGSLSRRSLATVSQWMDAIFKHGEHAYGVGDNPSARPRHRRKRRKLQPGNGEEESPRNRPVQQGEAHPRVRSPRAKAPDYRRKAMENAAAPPGIPAPLISSVERSLDDASKNNARGDTSQSPAKQKPQEEALRNQDQDQSYFDTEKMMGFLKLGYGSSWTFNPKGFHKDEASGNISGDLPPTTLEQQEEQLKPELQEVDPTPEASDDEAEKEKSFVQHLEQSIGRFLIGLSGDLENAEFDADLPDSPESNTNPQASPKRLYMRTLTVQMSDSHIWKGRRPGSPVHPYRRSTSIGSSGSVEVKEPPTSAAASVDGATPNIVYGKVRVVVYVHQPFIFTFLFDLQTPNLTMPSFYRSIHHQLGPLQKPLLRSTDPTRIPERVLGLLNEKAGDIEVQSNGLYDLIYDPSKRTVRTSIPNIPLPGTLAAEGVLSSQSTTPTAGTVSGAWYTLGIPVGSTSLSSTPTSKANDGNALFQTDWTRLESLNVHIQILNIWGSTRKSRTAKLDRAGDLEQTIKTARGWWIVWMRVPPPLSSAVGTRPSSSATMRHWKESMSADEVKEAYLVRQSVDAGLRAKEANAKSASSGKWLLRDQTRDVSGSTSGSQTAAATSARGVVEGVGVDARRWVEGLSKLSQ